MKQQKGPYITYAILISLFILIMAFFCLLWILAGLSRSADDSGKNGKDSSSAFTADIYQNGALLQSIPLDAKKEPYSFQITGTDGCFNEITVSGVNIAVTDASCPDKLCVRQGAVSTPLLPITCLPNRLVIRIRKEDSAAETNIEDSITPDIISY